MPKLRELYEHYYGFVPENLHNAKNDVQALVDILFKMVEEDEHNKKY